MIAADKVDASVGLHSFDEVDGPRLLRDGPTGLEALGLDAASAASLWAELSTMPKMDVGDSR